MKRPMESAGVREGKRTAPLPPSPLFQAGQYVLVVGEADFAFSAALAHMVGGGNILATTLLSATDTHSIYPTAMDHCAKLAESGAIVTYDLDCTTKALCDMDLQFDRIVFNFPETARGPDDLELAVPYNKYLLAAFFHEAARLLLPSGKIYVTIKAGWPFDLWDMKRQGSNCPFLQPLDVLTLPHPDFPAYVPKCTMSEDSFGLDGSHLYTFQLKPEYDTIALQNTLRAHAHPPPKLDDFLPPATAPLRPNPRGPPPIGTPAPRPTGLSAPSPQLGTVPFATPPTNFPFTWPQDLQGIIYHLGVVAGGGRFKNPVLNGLIEVEASSVKRGSAVGAEVCDPIFGEQVFYTDNQPGSWITIKFRDHAVSPSHYSFSHRCAMPDYFVRNWALLGSNDGEAWTVIRKHVNDVTLHPSCFSGSWPLPPQGEFFRQFRVALADRGNSRGTNALVLSCFELYGLLAE